MIKKRETSEFVVPICRSTTRMLVKHECSTVKRQPDS